MKPVSMVAEAIRNSSERGATVLDPFSGSGTTLMACEIENRNCCAMELDPQYCQVIVDRYNDYSNNISIDNGGDSNKSIEQGVTVNE